MELFSNVGVKIKGLAGTLFFLGTFGCIIWLIAAIIEGYVLWVIFPSWFACYCTSLLTYGFGILVKKAEDDEKSDNDTTVPTKNKSADSYDPEKERTYQKALSNMQHGLSHKTIPFYAEAIRLFNRIPDYQDTPVLIEECKQRIEELSKNHDNI